MTDDIEGSTTLSPDEAFTVLGDETRLQILRTLAEADDPMVFSDLFERIDYDTTANFSYHLQKLEGHFVRKTDAGYTLRQAGRRLVQVILSGAVTDDPVSEPTQIDRQCPFCGAPIEVSFQGERVGIYCTECSGVFGEAASRAESFDEYGHLGNMFLPPAGVQGRTATEMLDAAWAWSHLEIFARGSGLCPRCSASVEYSVDVCENHDAADGFCDHCERRFAGHRTVRCTNCPYAAGGIVTGRLLANTDYLAFMTTHGINPVVPSEFDRAMAAMVDFDEEIVSTEPFTAKYTFAVGEDALTLTVDDDLSVVDVTRSHTIKED